MKTVFSLILLVSFGMITFSQRELNLPFKSVQSYQNTQQNTLYLETDFGSPTILNKKDVRTLKNKRIYHIDLIYTKFRESDDFDQLELNKNRIEQLKKLIPQIGIDQPDWTVFEQTGAIERSSAIEYYHGFVIHYGEDISYNNDNNHFSKLEVPFGIIGIDNQKGGEASYYTGSRIVMPIDAVYQKNGELVQGYYDLYYREFRDHAEIAVSNIPMFYNEHGKHEIFNSAGMYEIRAFKDGEELVLGKTAAIDFQSLGYVPELGYYALTDSGEWVQEGIIGKMEVNGPKIINTTTTTMSYYLAAPGVVGGKVKFRKYIPEDEIDQGNYQGFTRVNYIKGVDKGQVEFVMGTYDLKNYRIVAERNRRITEISDLTDTLGVLKTVHVYNKDTAEFISLLLGTPFKDLDRKIEKAKDAFSQDFTIYQTKDYSIKKDSLLVVTTIGTPPEKAGLIYGLRARNFGVYNCDQTLRIQEPMALQPTYYDKETNQKLENLYQTCVIDMNINGSLSYAPNHIYCSKKGRTQLVIFGQDNQVYLFNKADMATVDLTKGNVDMRVTNITKKVDTPQDLKAILGIY
ncbi:MAG: hypothetical protein R2780_06880 [Crocinitomicaceae bacterium]|nr:hypothetical protein [Crocinitomicaceae bacterium]